VPIHERHAGPARNPYGRVLGGGLINSIVFETFWNSLFHLEIGLSGYAEIE
jgi:hypothetical protein